MLQRAFNRFSVLVSAEVLRPPHAVHKFLALQMVLELLLGDVASKLGLQFHYGFFVHPSKVVIIKMAEVFVSVGQDI